MSLILATAMASLFTLAPSSGGDGVPVKELHARRDGAKMVIDVTLNEKDAAKLKALTRDKPDERIKLAFEGATLYEMQVRGPLVGSAFQLTVD